MTDSKNWQKLLTSAGRLRLSRTPMLGKRRLLNSCFYSGASSAKLGTVKGRGSSNFAKSDWMEIEKSVEFPLPVL